jgi:tetratricopeptide (TPR) repeat protein
MTLRRVTFGIGCLLALTWVAAPARAALDAGTEPALYLGTGAKSVGAGRTGVAAAGDVSAADWNPAGLAYVPRCEILLQHAPLFGMANHDTVSLAYPLLDLGAVAASWTRLELGGIERRDDLNQAAGEFGFRQQEFSLAFANEIWRPLAIGAALKLHDLRVDSWESMAPGLDLGVLARFEKPFVTEKDKTADFIRTVNLGASVRNAAGPLLKLKDEAERLRPTYRLGAELGLALIGEISDRLTLKVDAEKPELQTWRLHAGVDYSCFEHFAVRGGWDQEYFAAGAGVSFGGIALDYAVSFPTLGLRHLLTFSVAFGDNLQDVQARRRAEEERQRQAVVDKLKNEIIVGYDKQAKDFAAAGKYAEAVKLWEKVLDWDPANAETQANLKVAREQLRLQEIAALLAQAQAYLKDERYVDTMLECRRILEMDPKHTEAVDLYAQAEKKATTLGELAFAKEVKSLARIKEHYLAGLRAYAQQNWEGAIKHWEQVIVDSPMQKQVYMYLDKARTQYEKYKQGQGQPLAPAEQKRIELYKKAVGLSQAGKLKDAALTWEKIINENPKDEDAKGNLDRTRKEFIESEKRGIRW